MQTTVRLYWTDHNERWHALGVDNSVCASGSDLALVLKCWRTVYALNRHTQVPHEAPPDYRPMGTAKIHMN